MKNILRIDFGLTIALSVLVTNVVVGQKPQDQTEPVRTPYPRVNLVAGYQIDPAWPQKPADFQWEAVPGVAVDREDRVWVFTRSKPPIQVYTSDGEFVRAWGSEHIDTAHHLKIDADNNVWIADTGLHVVRKFSPGGQLLLTLGTPGEAGNDETHFFMPTDMAVAPNGDIFVADGYGNNRVVHFNAQGEFVKAWGELGTGPDQFSLPHAIACDSQGRLYVADRNNVRVQVFDQSGSLLASWANLLIPWGFWITERDEVWVCGSSPMRWEVHPDYPDAPIGCPPKDQLIMRFDTNGKLHELWTLPKGRDGEEQPGDVNWLHALAFDSAGNLYVGDIIGKRAQKFTRHAADR